MSFNSTAHPLPFFMTRCGKAAPIPGVQFDGTTGRVVIDQSGNGNHGKMHGGVKWTGELATAEEAR